MLPWPAPPLADDVVTLRPWRADDEAARLAGFADPAFQRFSDWEPDDLATQEQRRLRAEVLLHDLETRCELPRITAEPEFRLRRVVV